MLTLDLVITKSDDIFIGGVSVFDPVISDHSAVEVSLHIPKTAIWEESSQVP